MLEPMNCLDPSLQIIGSLVDVKENGLAAVVITSPQEWYNPR